MCLTSGEIIHGKWHRARTKDAIAEDLAVGAKGAAVSVDVVLKVPDFLSKMHAHRASNISSQKSHRNSHPDVELRVQEYPHSHVKLARSFKEKRALDILLHEPGRGLEVFLHIQKIKDFSFGIHDHDIVTMGAIGTLEDPGVVLPLILID